MFKHNFHFAFFFYLVVFSLPQCQILDEGKQAKNEPNKEQLFRAEVISFAKEQLGTKYRYAGRDQRGFDCSGFTYFVMKNFDIGLTNSSKTQVDEGKKVEVEQVKAGDLIFFKRSKLGPVFHVALVVDNNSEGLQVIHSTSRGVVIDNISNSKYWQPKIFTARNVISAQIKQP